MIKKDTIELEIEKNVYEGFCLSRYEGKAVLLKDAIKGEIVKAEIKKNNKNYILCETIEVIKKSKERITPICPLSKPCGGCDFQFAKIEYLLKMKEDIIKEIFQNFEGLEIKGIKSVKNPLNYRHKAQYPVSETKNSKRLLIGYYKKNSHDIVDIKFCPIQPEIFDEIIKYVRSNWKLGGYIEKTHRGILRNIVIRQSSTEKTILINFVLNLDEKGYLKNKKELSNFADELIKNFPQIKGVFANLNNKKTNKITGDKTILISGDDFIFQGLEDKIYKIGIESFFQINPFCAEILFGEAKKLIKEKGTLLDLYGGVGTIGIFMKDKVDKITLIEENPACVNFAKENYKLNGICQYEIFLDKANSKMNDFIKEKKSFKTIVLDPPRKGSDIETLENISKMTNSLLYISCNPKTLERDAKVLIENGFKFKSIQPFDMFPYTYHIESLAYFEKEEV